MGYAYQSPFPRQTTVQRKYYAKTEPAQYTITNAASNQNFRAVTIPSLSDTIARAFLNIYIGQCYNSAAGTNKTNATQYIKVDNTGLAGYITAIEVIDDSLRTNAGQTRTNIMLAGTTDISSKVISGDEIKIRWENSRADSNNLVIWDINAELVLELYRVGS